MKQYDRSKVVENYYIASNALMEIGTTKDIPEELKQLTISASAETIRIIDYINTHKNVTIFNEEIVETEGCCYSEYDFIKKKDVFDINPYE